MGAMIAIAHAEVNELSVTMRGRVTDLKRFACFDFCEARVHTCFAYFFIKGTSKGVGVGCKADAHTPLARSGQHGEGVLVEEDGKTAAGHIVDGLIVTVGDDREGTGVLHQ